MSERKPQTKSKKMPRKARRYECRDSEEKTAEMPPNAEKDKAETKCREGKSKDCETKSKKKSRKARRYSEEKTAEGPSDKAETKCCEATSQERETRRPGRLSAISNWWRGLRNRGGRRRNEELSPALTEQSTSASPEDLPGPSSASGSKTHALKYTYNSQEDVTTEAASRKEDTRPTTFSEGRHLSFWQKFKRFRKNKVTPFREPEEETSEPRRPVKKSSIKINKVSDEPGFRQEFLCSTIDTSPQVHTPEPLPEPPVVVSRRRPTNRLAASDVEYHSTLVSVYDKEC
ncbi:uncharacterized protein LOC111137131 [Crassostrea virginica]